MPSNHERISNALNALTAGVAPFVEAELRATYGETWRNAASGSFREDRGHAGGKSGTVQWDAHSLLTVMWDQWNKVFRNKLGHAERSLVSELREYRNRWAHQAQFNFDDTYRVLDSAARLLTAVSSTEADRVDRSKRELMRSEVGSEATARNERMKFRRRKWRLIGTYVFCCAIIVYTLLLQFGSDLWIVGASIAVLFGYFTWQVLMEQQVLSGPHECQRCRRIIYAEPCPYCQPAAAPLDAPADAN